MGKKLSLQRTEVFLGMLFLIILAGLLLRLKLVFERALWVDELFYFHVAYAYRFKEILLVEHYVKDLPPLFPLFLKVWMYINYSIFWIRLPGLLLYLASCVLLVKVFNKLHWIGSLIVTAFFAFSPFFIYLNYWVTPFNFVLLFTLIQLFLLSEFFQGKFVKKEKLFIVLFGLINLLLFNSHYSSVYLFLSYPFILLYLAIKEKKLAKTYFYSCLVSTALLIPNLILILKLRGSVVEFLMANVTNVIFPTIFHLVLYIFDYSIFRLGANWTSLQIILIFVALVLISFLIRKKKAISSFWLLIFLSIFSPSVIFLYLFYREYPSIFVERTFGIFHLGFYFLLAYTLDSVSRISKASYGALSVFFIGLLMFGHLVKLVWLKERCLPAGDVTCYMYKQANYDNFINDTVKILSQGNNWTIIRLGDNFKNVYQGMIFSNYYFPLDSRFAGVNEGFERDKNFFVITELSILERLKINPNSRILLLNFDRWWIDRKELEWTVEEYEGRMVLINFWDYFKD